MVYIAFLPKTVTPYVGESGWKLKKMLNKHKSKEASSKSAIKEHLLTAAKIDWVSVKVLELEPKDFS